MTDPYALTTHDGKTVDEITHQALIESEKLLGYDLTVVQGSYQALDGQANDVAASAGTHDGGGVVDLLAWDWERKVHVLRAVGFAAWHRPAVKGVWGEHIHAVLIGNKNLAPSAARQVEAYRAHRDGLKSNAPDPTWHPDPIPVFVMPQSPRVFFPVQHRIVTANLYVKNDRPAATVGKVIAAVKGRFSFPPDVIACQETHGAGTLAKLATVGDYRLLAADPKFGEAGLELGVLLRRGLKVIDTEFHPAAKGVGDGVTDHDRGVFVVKYVKRRRRVAVVNCHAPVFNEAAIHEGAKPGPAAIQHAAYATKVAAIVTRLRAHGWTVFVVADANSRAHWDQSLPVVLERLGMALTRDGVDLTAHDPKRVDRKAVQLVALGATGTPESAHEAIAARYIEKRKS